MQDASDKKRALEKEHKECVIQLQDKQRELQNRLSNISYAEKTRLCEHIESLQVNNNHLKSYNRINCLMHTELRDLY